MRSLLMNLMVSCIAVMALLVAIDSSNENRGLWEVLTAKSVDLEKTEAERNRGNELLSKLYGVDMTGMRLASVIEYPVKITFYSLSVDECDGDPLTAAFGPSRVFMAALSRDLERDFGLKSGDRFAVISHDGEIRAIVEFWDRLNQGIDGYQVDVVAPRKEVAKWYGVKKGHAIKMVLEPV